MQNQSPEPIDTAPAEEVPAEFQAPTLFRAAPTPGRPSSTSTTAPPNPSTPATPPTPPAESSTSPAPSWSTEPRPAEPPAPAPSPSGSSPSEEEDGGLPGTIGRILGSVTGVAHALTDDVGKAHGLFLATEAELTGASAGAASILSRRLPGLGNSETGDLVQIGVAVASYAARTWKLWQAARQTRAEIKAQTTQATQAA